MPIWPSCPILRTFKIKSAHWFFFNQVFMYHQHNFYMGEDAVNEVVSDWRPTAFIRAGEPRPTKTTSHLSVGPLNNRSSLPNRAGIIVAPMQVKSAKQKKKVLHAPSFQQHSRSVKIILTHSSVDTMHVSQHCRCILFLQIQGDRMTCYRQQQNKQKWGDAFSRWWTTEKVKKEELKI